MLSTHYMSRRTKLIAAAGAVVLLAIGAYLLWFAAPRGTEVSGTLSDLVALPKPSKCSFDYSDDSVISSGTVYVSGGMLRGDFTFHIIPSGQQVTTHVIEKDGVRYSWAADSTMGSQAPVASSTGQSGVNTLYHYTCAPAAVASSSFDLPPGVPFLGQ
jgi:hypothetical protein